MVQVVGKVQDRRRWRSFVSDVTADQPNIVQPFDDDHTEKYADTDNHLVLKCSIRTYQLLHSLVFSQETATNTK